MKVFAQRSAVLLAGLTLLACGANAAGAKPQKEGAASVEAVKAEVQKKFPQRPVSSVRPTPVKGLYEVVFAPRQVVYTDAKADYMLVGDLVDVARKTSMTEERVRELSRTDFSKLPLDQALKLVRGNGSRKVAVFSDPDCPFCKRLEQDVINKLDNVTVYTFLFPLTSLHPDAPRKSNLIWCQPEPQKAWTDFMINNKLPTAAPAPNCTAPLEKIQVLAEQLGITGTPAMVFESGDIVSGAIPMEEFERQLVAKKP
ncbi:DsbC family protein [Chitinimonas lacunae]|uniref:Thiol:disulfide interchange protein n=1 Tax=Chitinimonas lacunae TaxID=1963018 RepID=A0ABV8MVP9_9NEIS